MTIKDLKAALFELLGEHAVLTDEAPECDQDLVDDLAELFVRFKSEDVTP